MRQRPSSQRSGFVGAAIGAAFGLAAGSLHAEEAAAVPLSATSQCVEGPGAPPADPSKVTRVVPGAVPPADAPVEAVDSADPPGAPARVLLELGALAGASVRFDDAPALVTTRRLGLVLGGSAFVAPSRSLALGLTYAHAGLSASETAPLSADVIVVDYAAHTLIGEIRVTPVRFAWGSIFAAVGGGLAWQTASLRATFVPLGGLPASSLSCSASSGAEFAFRAGVGLKARFSRAVSLLVDAGFVGYRFEDDVLDDCAPGAGTAQTVMVRAGLTYDVDVTRLVR